MDGSSRVQNADDAKATTVRFVLDHNHYPTGATEQASSNCSHADMHVAYASTDVSCTATQATQAAPRPCDLRLLKPAYRCHAESLLSPQLQQFQGPALLAYNDGVFNEKVKHSRESLVYYRSARCLHALTVSNEQPSPAIMLVSYSVMLS